MNEASSQTSMYCDSRTTVGIPYLCQSLPRNFKRFPCPQLDLFSIGIVFISYLSSRSEDKPMVSVVSTRSPIREARATASDKGTAPSEPS